MLAVWAVRRCHPLPADLPRPLFTPTRWPGFGAAEFETALADYAGRTRSFGGVVAAA